MKVAAVVLLWDVSRCAVRDVTIIFKRITARPSMNCYSIERAASREMVSFPCVVHA